MRIYQGPLYDAKPLKDATEIADQTLKQFRGKLGDEEARVAQTRGRIEVLKAEARMGDGAILRQQEVLCRRAAVLHRPSATTTRAPLMPSRPAPHGADSQRARLAAQPYQVADARSSITRDSAEAARTMPSIMLLSLVALGGCAGYRFGNQSLFPADIETVHVPMFQSSSFRQNLGEELTEAVVKEIERRTPYKVVRDANADSVLIGRITEEHKHMLVETINGDQREMEMNMVVSVRWVNRRGDLIRTGPPIPVANDAVTINASAHFVPEYGQSNATAEMQEIQRIARKIVDLMEAPW